MAENDLGIWFRSIPIVTRWWFSLSIAFPLLGKLGLINGYHMILDYHSIVSRFQIWRLFTAFVYYPIMPQTGFHYLINLYFLYSYSSRLETGKSSLSQVMSKVAFFDLFSIQDPNPNPCSYNKKRRYFKWLEADIFQRQYMPWRSLAVGQLLLLKCYGTSIWISWFYCSLFFFLVELVLPMFTSHLLICHGNLRLLPFYCRLRNAVQYFDTVRGRFNSLMAVYIPRLSFFLKLYLVL